MPRKGGGIGKDTDSGRNHKPLRFQKIYVLTYSIFAKEDNIPMEQIDLDDGMWHMHFDGSCSNEGNKDGIILISPVGKIQNFSYQLEFACTNNVTEFKALLLGIENVYNIGCGHLSVFGDSELVVNLVCKIYSPSNKLMK
jgi:hypothetical protein